MKLFENLECKGRFWLRSDICHIDAPTEATWIAYQGSHFAIGVLFALAPLVLARLPLKFNLSHNVYLRITISLFILFLLKQFWFDWRNGFWKWQFFVDGSFDLLFVALGFFFAFCAVAIHGRERSAHVTESA